MFPCVFFFLPVFRLPFFFPSLLSTSLSFSSSCCTRRWLGLAWPRGKKTCLWLVATCVLTELFFSLALAFHTLPTRVRYFFFLSQRDSRVFSVTFMNTHDLSRHSAFYDLLLVRQSTFFFTFSLLPVCPSLSVSFFYLASVLILSSFFSFLFALVDTHSKENWLLSPSAAAAAPFKNSKKWPLNPSSPRPTFPRALRSSPTTSTLSTLSRV